MFLFENTNKFIITNIVKTYYYELTVPKITVAEEYDLMFFLEEQ